MSDSYILQGEAYLPFSANIAGFIVPMVTGCISVCSSSLILHVILKSQTRLSSTYNRIMAFMSFFDICSSVFIALGPIMTPQDNLFKLSGPKFGNRLTCRIQGWFVTFGLAGATSMNVCLSWYFVFRIVFKISSKRLATCLEPIMYVYTLLFLLFLPTFYLSHDLLNSGPYDSFCFVVPYPESCDEEIWYDWSKCAWKEGELDSYVDILSVTLSLIGSQFMLILIGMLLILWSIRKRNQSIKKTAIASESTDELDISSAQELNNSSRNEKVVDELRFSRILAVQGLMYIAAFFVTWFLTLVSEFGNVANFELDALNAVLFPLQGFWNLLIFLYDRISSIRHNHRGTTFWQALEITLTYPEDEPVILNMSDLHTNDDNERGIGEFVPDPFINPHFENMFHFRRRGERIENDAEVVSESSTSERDEPISVNENDLPSQNDESSRFDKSYGTVHDCSFSLNLISSESLSKVDQRMEASNYGD